jgi:hypothetical protein
MLSNIMRVVIYWQNSWFYALIDEALTERRRKYDYTGITILRKAINAVIIVLIVHPEVEFVLQKVFLSSLLPWNQTH